jgi:hypothetical protein
LRLRVLAAEALIPLAEIHRVEIVSNGERSRLSFCYLWYALRHRNFGTFAMIQ